jgi:pilus assembly protein CpaB
MSLRLIAIALILTTAVALGMIAYQLAAPPPPAQTVQETHPPPLAVGYLVAAHPSPAGTLLRDEDFQVKMAPAAAMPAGAMADSPEMRTGLRGAMLRHYVEANAPFTADDVIRPHDRGFLATVLAPGTRAVSIGVDQVTGVASLIWPGDLVDVILTQEFDQALTPLAKRVLSETILSNVKVIAVDQDIAQGGSPAAAGAGRASKTVTLEVTTEQAERLTVAQHLGRLAFTVRAIDDVPDPDHATIYGSDVSPALARVDSGGSRMQVIQGETRSEVTFK